MYLRRMRNGVRSAPSEDRHRRPAFDPILGAPTPARFDAPDAEVLRSGRTDPPDTQPPAALCRHHLLVVLSRILQPASNHPLPLGSMPPATPDGGGAAPESGRADRSACPRPRPSSRQHSLVPGAKTKCGKSHARSDMRLETRGDGARVIEQQSGTRSPATGGAPGRPTDPLSQPSQHLPFPFRNARVEVGRTVMEG